MFYLFLKIGFIIFSDEPIELCLAQRHLGSRPPSPKINRHVPCWGNFRKWRQSTLWFYFCCPCCKKISLHNFWMLELSELKEKVLFSGYFEGFIASFASPLPNLTHSWSMRSTGYCLFNAAFLFLEGLNNSVSSLGLLFFLFYFFNYSI